MQTYNLTLDHKRMRLWYMALLKPGDTVLGMNLAQGGHLTHGSPVNFSGKLYNIVPYGIDEASKIDYQDIAEQIKSIKPK